MNQIVLGSKSNQKQQEYSLELLHTLLRSKHGVKVVPIIAHIHWNRSQGGAISQEELIALLREMAIDEGGNFSEIIRAGAIYALGLILGSLSEDILNKIVCVDSPLLEETWRWSTRRLDRSGGPWMGPRSLQ